MPPPRHHHASRRFYADAAAATIFADSAMLSMPYFSLMLFRYAAIFAAAFSPCHVTTLIHATRRRRRVAMLFILLRYSHTYAAYYCCRFRQDMMLIAQAPARCCAFSP